MLVPALLLTTGLLLAQTPAVPAESPALLAPSMVLPTPSHLSLTDAKAGRASPAWVLARVPLAIGAGILAGLVGYYVGAPLTFVATLPFGCLVLLRDSPPACYHVSNFGGFVFAGLSSAVAVAGVGTLLHGEGDFRYTAAMGLLGGIGFATAYVLNDPPDALLADFQGEKANMHRLAFVAVPALALLTYEVSALLSPSRPIVRLAPTLVPTSGGGALFAVAGRF
jgi:hypothetical protein